MDAAYNREVAVRARKLLRNATDPEARETLKAIIRIFDPRDEDARRPIAAENPPRRRIEAIGSITTIKLLR
jgi:hypothetical protein